MEQVTMGLAGINLEQLWAEHSATVLSVGWKLVAAIAIWVIGRWIIGIVTRVVDKGMVRTDVDKTLRSFVQSLLRGILTVVLLIAIFSQLGVNTTTFAALLAGAGLAIGAAWGGMLQNFAAGAFLLILRPFKVGDYVTAGGVEGTVDELGLFTTVINTPANVKTILANNKIFSETIQNFTANPYRRVELKAQLAHGADHNKAIQILSKELANIANVISDPAPSVELLEFNLAGPVLAVRPFCHNDHYWPTYFATNKVIRESLGAAGFATPQTHHHVKKAA